MALNPNWTLASTLISSSIEGWPNKAGRESETVIWTQRALVSSLPPASPILLKENPRTKHCGALWPPWVWASPTQNVSLSHTKRHASFPSFKPKPRSSRKLPKLLTIPPLSHLTVNFHSTCTELCLRSLSPHRSQPPETSLLQQTFLSLQHETPCEINVFHSSADTDGAASLSSAHPSSCGKLLSIPARQEVILAEGLRGKKRKSCPSTGMLINIARSLQERHTLTWKQVAVGLQHASHEQLVNIFFLLLVTYDKSAC